MIEELRLTLKVLTPLFIGDSDQRAELRPPGIKGSLRYWYRALDPFFRDPWVSGARSSREDQFFGGVRSGAGQSPFLLRIEPATPQTKSLSEFNPKRFDRGYGRDTRNGMIYLGYPFNMGENTSRTSIIPGETLKVRCLIPGGVNQASDYVSEMRRVLLASWWLLCHVGGLGSRSRRGFGSLDLEEWKVDSLNGWPELNDLPLPSRATDTAGWRREFDQGLRRIQDWFPKRDARHAVHTKHPHLGASWRWVLLDTGRPLKQWDEALADAGSRMQDFRLRSDPDYQQVKDHIQARDRKGGKYMRAAPQRSSFGLPLTFRYTSLNARSLTLLPYDSAGGGHFERHGSLLHLRLVRVGGQVHPLFARLDGAIPGLDPPVMVRGESNPLSPFAVNAMDRFMDELTSGVQNG